ncbi:gamma-glutamylcyclotransferase family protein [Thioalkalivibrio sp. XN279]|uniref:gamma-glutamylcyclotransferase family protein n=1 Tax=Thioalkalivibrio sp. XN279 TaxID=2714953 RepID=UPI00140CA212|nr:gamma-glutamylcyclotransferase family protein [Thioalkalivibrio sp. XN279]NHA13424.1 gamma-glutamylcyclotransferase [Thioalkalivibrio sp. XN279]
MSAAGERVLYFAYGANVHPGWLRRRIPDAELVGAAALPGHRLAFRKRGRDGAARSDAEPSGTPGDVLPGVLYAVRREALDQLGAAGAGYRMEEVEVLVAGAPRRALTWRAEDSAVAAGLDPPDWYVDLIRAGAAMLELPAAHRRWLASVTVKVDRDSAQSRVARTLLAAGTESGPG